jgi:hypothetical protein
MKICISACKDEQRAWEGPTGASLTKVSNVHVHQLSLLTVLSFQEFIQILRDDPHPSLKELLTQLT